MLGEWKVLPGLNSLERAGRTVHLEPKVMQVLVILAEHSGQVASKEQIFARVWPDTFVSDEVLTRAISELRKAFEDYPQQPKYIQTIPKGGYRLVAPVVREPTKHSYWLVHRKKVATIAAAILLAAAASLYALRAREHATSKTAITSLAVLPLTNLSGDAGQDYFADGMTDELITRLSNISALRVISRTSVMHYKGTQKTIPEIARELNVDAVMEGAVQRSGDRVRVSAQLIETRTDRHLWAESYERDLRDVLALEGEVSSAIAREVQLQLTPTEHARLSDKGTLSPEAHEAYLKGSYYWNKLTEEDVRKSVTYFEEAIRLAPSFAPAYASLAFSYNLLASDEYVAPQDGFPKAKELARKALDLDQNLAGAHAALGYALYLFDWNWAAAEAEFRRANELEPNGQGARGVYALYLSSMGRHEEAIAEMKRVVELDPLAVLALWNLGSLYWDAGQPEQAVEQFRKILEIDSNSPDGHQGLGITYAMEKRYDNAIAELQQAVKLSGQDVWMKASLGYAYAVAGRKKAAREVLSDLERTSKRKYVSGYLIATVYAGLGDKEAAFHWLEAAFENRDCQMPQLRNEPSFESLRSDPRFGELVRRIGLPSNVSR
jgi:TolB-like protein/DNA-binding winged helix-turn-helix (wHTH) protein/Tfp pilus assembly protein PilF